MQRDDDHISPDNIDMASVVSVVARSIRRILVAGGLVGAATFVTLSMMSKQYTSEARILIDNDVPEAVKPAGANAGDAQGPDRETVASQVEVIKSRDLAGRVVQGLRLGDNPEFNSALRVGVMSSLLSLFGLSSGSEAQEDARVLAKFYERLRVFNIRDSRVIAVEFRADDAELAARGANVLADSYIEWQKAERLNRDRGAGQVIGDEITKLRAELTTAETELEQVRAETGQVRSGPGGSEATTVQTQQIGEINTKLSEARSQQVDAEARARIIRSMRQQPGQVDASPDVLKSPIVQQLLVQRVAVDRQMAELSATLLSGHPRMKQLRSELSRIDTQIAAEARKIVTSLDNEARVAAARQEALRAELDRLVQASTTSGGSVARVRQLEAAVRSKRDLLETYERRYRDARTRGTPTAVPAFAKIISRAQPASEPVFPKPLPHSLLAIAATLTIGLSLSLLKALFQSAQGRSSRRAIGGEQPRLPREIAHPAAGGRDEGRASSVERRAGPTPTVQQPAIMVSLEAVAWRLLNRGQPQSAQRVIFSGGGETRRLATEALDLAHMLVSAGHRVLLIDWSGASRVIPSRLGLVVREGLAEAVTSDIGFDTVVHATRVEGLDYIGTGTPVDVFREPRAVEAGRRAQMLLEALDRNYEVIVLVADEAEARTLLRLLNGGFDAAVEVAHATRSGEANSAEYLGLRVSGLEILRYRPNASARAPIRDGRARAASEKAASA